MALLKIFAQNLQTYYKNNSTSLTTCIRWQEWCAAVCTERYSASRHQHVQVWPWLVTPAVWGVALAWCLRMHPVQTGSHSAPQSVVQGSCVPGRLLYTSLRHSQPTSFMVSNSTSPDRTTGSALSVIGASLLQVRRPGTHYQTVSVTQHSPATASDNHWRRIYFKCYYSAHAVHYSCLMTLCYINRLLTLTYLSKIPVHQPPNISVTRLQ